MNVLVVHNRYQERGGEDRVVALESALLERYGHTVVPYIVDNRDIDSIPTAMLPLLTIWNSKTVDAVKLLIGLERIDVVPEGGACDDPVIAIEVLLPDRRRLPDVAVDVDDGGHQ